MKCFDSGKPKLSASNIIENKKAKTIYQHNASRNNTMSKNHQGTIVYENNAIKQARSYDTLFSLNKGYHLCKDCSGGSPAQPSMAFSTSTVMNLTDVSFVQLYNGTWNALDNPTTLDGSGVTIDPSNNLFGTTCSKKKYMNYVTVSGVDLSGNTTAENYLQYFDFHKKINLK